MKSLKNIFNKIQRFFNKREFVTTTDQIPQGAQNIYLINGTNPNAPVDNLLMAPNFNVVSSKLDFHLGNVNNPHSQILSGLRTHQTEINLTADITLNITNYIDCLLVQSSNANNRVITIPDETALPQQFATNAAFIAFRLGTAALTVTLQNANVTFVNSPYSAVSSIVLPANGYYLFIRQSINKWAVVSYAAASTSTTLDQAYANGDGSISVLSGKPFLLRGAGANQIANFDRNKITFNANTAYTVTTIQSTGEQAHPPQIPVPSGIVVDSSNVDSVFINTGTCVVKIELEPGTFYADNSTFDVWRLNSFAMQVSAALGVSINGVSGALITIPAGAYYSFRRQALNSWSYVIMNGGTSGSQVVISWDGSTSPVAVTAGTGISITGGVVATTASLTLQGIYNNSSPKQINFGANQGLALIGDGSSGAQVNFSGLSQFSLNVSAPYTAALQQIDSTTQGWMGPRATLTQRNLINVSANPIGLETFNTTDKTKDYWDGTQWQQILTVDHLLAGTGITLNKVGGTVTVNSTAGSVTLQDAYNNSSNGVITVTPVKPFQIKDASNNVIATFGQDYSSANNRTIVDDASPSPFVLTTLAAVNIFVIQTSSQCNLKLPVTAMPGQIFKIIGGTATWTLSTNAGQFIHVFSDGGIERAAIDMTSTQSYDSAELSINDSANTHFVLTQTNSPQLDFNY